MLLQSGSRVQRSLGVPARTVVLHWARARARCCGCRTLLSADRAARLGPLNSPRARSTRPTSGSPRAKRRRLSITTRAALAGCVMLAMCGVMRTRGCDHSGCSGGSGSGSVTSSTASARWPPSSAASRSARRAAARGPTCTRLAPLRQAREQLGVQEAARRVGQRQQAHEDLAVRKEVVQFAGARQAAHAFDRMARAAPAGAVEAEGTSCASTAWPSEPRPSTPTRRSPAVFTGSGRHSRALLGAPVLGHVAMQVEHGMRDVLDHAANDAGLDHAHHRQLAAAAPRSRTGRRRRPRRTAASGWEIARRCRAAAPTRPGSARCAASPMSGQSRKSISGASWRKISAHCRPRTGSAL